MVYDKKQINNYFEACLILNGYKVFDDNLYGSLRIFQKKIADSIGIKYYINCYHYNHGLKFPQAPIQDSYMFKCQFYLDKSGKDQTVNVDFSGDFIPTEYSTYLTTLKDAEDFCESMFKNMGTDYCEFYE